LNYFVAVTGASTDTAAREDRFGLHGNRGGPQEGPPDHGEAQDIEGDQRPQGGDRPPGERGGDAVALRDEPPAVRTDGGDEAERRRRLDPGRAQGGEPALLVRSGSRPQVMGLEGLRDHLERGPVPDAG